MSPDSDTYLPDQTSYYLLNQYAMSIHNHLRLYNYNQQIMVNIRQQLQSHGLKIDMSVVQNIHNRVCPKIISPNH